MIIVHTPHLMTQGHKNSLGGMSITIYTHDFLIPHSLGKGCVEPLRWIPRTKNNHCGPHRNELVIKRFKDDGSSLLILLLCCFWPAGSASASVIGSLFSTRAINHKDCSSWPPRQIKTAKPCSTTRAEEC